MRKIKFRGRIKKLGLYAIGEYFRVRGTDGNVRHMIDASIDKPDAGVAVYEIDPETLGQWSGCVDKAGVEIYEGDKVSLTTGRRTIIGQVEFVNGAFVLMSASEEKYRPKAFILGDIDDLNFGDQVDDVKVLAGDAQ